MDKEDDDMKSNIRIAHLLALIASAASLSSFAQTSSDAPPPELAARVAAAQAAVMRGGSGPYPAVMTTETSLATHTVFRPRNIAAAASTEALPIIAWGNGACSNFGNRFRYFLTEIASRGYVVLAIGPIGPASLEWNTQAPGDSNLPPAERPAGSHASQLADAIDWAVAENGREGSAYRGHLDPNRIAVMGMSCGGLQAISAAADARVKALMVWNSGTFPEGTKPLPGTGDAAKSSLARLHTPVAYISGDASDIAHENANADYEAIVRVPVFRAWEKGIGHSGTYREPSGGSFTAVAVAWLDWQLKGNADSSQMFMGENCTLCRDDDWVVWRKGW